MLVYKELKVDCEYIKMNAYEYQWVVEVDNGMPVNETHETNVTKKCFNIDYIMSIIVNRCSTM